MNRPVAFFAAARRNRRPTRTDRAFPPKIIVKTHDIQPDDSEFNSFFEKITESPTTGRQTERHFERGAGPRRDPRRRGDPTGGGARGGAWRWSGEFQFRKWSSSGPSGFGRDPVARRRRPAGVPVASRTRADALAPPSHGFATRPEPFDWTARERVYKRTATLRGGPLIRLVHFRKGRFTLWRLK